MSQWRDLIDSCISRLGYGADPEELWKELIFKVGLDDKLATNIIRLAKWETSK